MIEIKIEEFMIALGDLIKCFMELLSPQKEKPLYSLNDFDNWSDDALDKYINSNGEYVPDFVRLAEALSINF